MVVWCGEGEGLCSGMSAGRHVPHIFPGGCCKALSETETQQTKTLYSHQCGAALLCISWRGVRTEHVCYYHSVQDAKLFPTMPSLTTGRTRELLCLSNHNSRGLGRFGMKLVLRALLVIMGVGCRYGSNEWSQQGLRSPGVLASFTSGADGSGHGQCW